MNLETTNLPKAVEDCHALLGWIIPHLDGFPRARRFTLGERIESGLLFVLFSFPSSAWERRLASSACLGSAIIKRQSFQGLGSQANLGNPNKPRTNNPALGQPQQEQAR